MAGTYAGGVKARETNIKKHGVNFYRDIGHIGGSKEHRETRAFYTDRELARKAGAIGGRKGKRGPAKKFIWQPTQYKVIDAPQSAWKRLMRRFLHG